ncbi:MAG: hemerythrin domain-containing protein [Fidelibacterota bacterium]
MPKCTCGTLPFTVNTENPDFYYSLPDGHVLQVLMQEHFNILRYTLDLEMALDELKGIDTIPDDNTLIRDLHSQADHLLSTERHHIREEVAILLSLDEIEGASNHWNIRTDHDEIRLIKRHFAKLVRSLYTTPLPSIKDEINSTGRTIITRLKTHIKNEDNELYPLAYARIPAENWPELKAKCDKVGYCCFTPPPN